MLKPGTLVASSAQRAFGYLEWCIGRTLEVSLPCNVPVRELGIVLTSMPGRVALEADVVPTRCYVLVMFPNRTMWIDGDGLRLVNPDGTLCESPIAVKIREYAFGSRAVTVSG